MGKLKSAKREISKRVKGTQDFWAEKGAAATRLQAARESRQIEGKCDKTLSHHTTTRRVTHPDQALNLEWPSKLCTRKENNTKLWWETCTA